MFRPPKELTMLGAVLNYHENAGPCGCNFDPLLGIIPGAFALYFASSSLYNNRLKIAGLIESRNSLGCDQINSEACNSLNRRIEGHGFYTYVWMLFILASLLVLGGTAYGVAKTYSNSRRRLNLHPNHKIALEFIEKNPTYPSDREKVTIECPLLLDKSDIPICLSFSFKDKVITRAYDYNALIKWFQQDKGLCDPYTNINLLDENVTELKFSFDIPKKIIEKSPVEQDENTEALKAANKF